MTPQQTLTDASALLAALAREERSVHYYKQAGLADPFVTAQHMRNLRLHVADRDVEWRAVVIPDTGAVLTVIRFDWDRDRESWAWHAVVSVSGALPVPDDSPDCVDVDAVQSALADVLPFQGAGNGGAGQPFADAPWLQFLGHPCRTIIVSQSGGLDV